MVVTTQHSLFAGGHFHSKEVFYNSLYSVTLQHYFGHAISNEVHSTACTTFQRLGIKYMSIVIDRNEDGSSNIDDEGDYFIQVMFNSTIHL